MPHTAIPGHQLYQFGQFQGGDHRPLMAMVEVTNRCNMSCPICFTGAEPEADDVPLKEVKQRLLQLKDLAGPIPVQISGGEPTLHPHLPEIIAHARSLGFEHIELITNGIRVSRQPGYLRLLTAKGLTAVYLQFDGLSSATHTIIRGQDMRDIRSRSIAATRAAGICCTLAVAVTRGVNDHELGDILRFAINNIDTVRAVNFQSATRFTGRYDIKEPSRGYSLQELLERLEEQTQLPAASFISGLLGHQQCNAMSLVYIVDNRLEPLFKYVPEEILTTLMGPDQRTTILDLFQGKVKFLAKHLANPSIWKALYRAAPIFGKFPTPGSIAKTDHLLVFAKSFMESDSMDDERIKHCCYALAENSGVFSFCAYNNLYRKQRSP